MIGLKSIYLPAMLAVAGLAPFATAQTTLPFVMKAQIGTVVTNFGDGATLPISAEAIGRGINATLMITYKGQSSASINSVELTGSTDFAVVAGGSGFPVVMLPNDVFSVAVRYTPTTGARVNAQISFNYTEGRTQSRFGANFNGTAPDFVFSFTPQGGNATPLVAGGTVTATPSALIDIQNRGTAPGVIAGVSLSGAAFQAANLPLANTSVDAGKDVSFTVSFLPTQPANSQGAVAVRLADRTVAFNVQASVPLFTYEVSEAGASTVVAPGGAIKVQDATVGDEATLVIRVRNSGNADGAIGVISVQGASFQLTDVPFLPLTLPVGNTVAFGMTFTPTQPGLNTARLRVGNDTFDVAGNGLGATFAYAYVTGGKSNVVQSNGPVFFTPTSVGKATGVEFQITNTGTAEATVKSISVSGTGFTLSGVPSLPLALAASASTSFTVQLTPTATGTATGTLSVDGQTFALSASVNKPDPLPDFKFEAPSGPQDPMQQPAVGLTLASPYPLPLSGTLTLKFNSDVFSDDPSVQFATGGRTVNFTIPANSTSAVFPQGGNQIKIQTGTVAGTIVVTPSFATTDSSINVTPDNPVALSLVVPQSAPRVLGVEIVSKSGNTFSLLIRGYATSRSVTQMDFQITGVSTENFASTKVTLNVEANFVSWYQGTTSQQYGSLFAATVPFTMAGDLKKVQQYVDAIQSVAVTLTNKYGTSAAQSVSFR